MFVCLSLNIRMPSLTFHTHSTHIPHLFHTHSTYTPHTLHTHSTYTPHTLYTHSTHPPHTPTHIPHTLHTHSTYTPHTLHTHSTHTLHTLYTHYTHPPHTPHTFHTYKCVVFITLCTSTWNRMDYLVSRESTHRESVSNQSFSLSLLLGLHHVRS